MPTNETKSEVQNDQSTLLEQMREIISILKDDAIDILLANESCHAISDHEAHKRIRHDIMNTLRVIRDADYNIAVATCERDERKLVASTENVTQ